MRTRALFLTILLILLEKTVIPFNLSLLFVLYWIVWVREEDTVFLILVTGILYDLTNNLLLGSSLLGFGVILGLAFAYRKIRSTIRPLDFLILCLVSLIVWEKVVAWVNTLV